MAYQNDKAKAVRRPVAANAAQLANFAVFDNQQKLMLHAMPAPGVITGAVPRATAGAAPGGATAGAAPGGATAGAAPGAKAAADAEAKAKAAADAEAKAKAKLKKEQQQRCDVAKYSPEIFYSDRYHDDEYEYRHVSLPKGLRRYLPKPPRILTEDEIFNLGVRQSPGWSQYMVHLPEPHMLLFRRDRVPNPSAGNGM
ncbi:hypothetical protein GGI07_004101 [Coemansia sp. Benny D115]|nr:hypothetical protein GGI07_004101 [Coemansia sp. Benny D115]